MKLAEAGNGFRAIVEQDVTGGGFVAPRRSRTAWETRHPANYSFPRSFDRDRFADIFRVGFEAAFVASISGSIDPRLS